MSRRQTGNAPPGYPYSGYPPQGYSHQPGYPPQEYPHQPGYPPQGYSQPGHPPPGHTYPGYPPQLYAVGYPPQPYASEYPPQPFAGEYPPQPHAPEPPSQPHPRGNPTLMHPPPGLVKNPGADRHGKGSSRNPAGTEPKHTKKKSISATHLKTESKRHHEKQGDTGRQRRPTNTADTGGSHARGHSPSTQMSFGKGGVTIKPHGSDVRITNDSTGTNIEMRRGAEKSSGHHGNVKDKKSSRENRSAEQRR